MSKVKKKQKPENSGDDSGHINLNWFITLQMIFSVLLCLPNGFLNVDLNFNKTISVQPKSKAK